MKLLIVISLSLLCNIVTSKILSHEEVLRICKNTCTVRENGKCVSRGYDDCTLVSALIFKESKYNSKAFNPEVTGSYGLMQVQCATARYMGLKFSCEQLYSPVINIRFGILYLINLRKKLKNSSVEDLISAYNAGLKKTIFFDMNLYEPFKCKKRREFRWHGAPKVVCYQDEYINEEYVWFTHRYYKHLVKIGAQVEIQAEIWGQQLSKK